MAVQTLQFEFSDGQRLKVIIIAALVSAMGFIDATALNVALPFIQSSLRASATDIHWVLEIYLLFLAALMMAGGALGDTLGRRRPLRWGVILFALTSLACAVSPSAEWLIFFRALQGISAALMIPASVALINAGFASEARGGGYWQMVGNCCPCDTHRPFDRRAGGGFFVLAFCVFTEFAYCRAGTGNAGQFATPPL